MKKENTMKTILFNFIILFFLMLPNHADYLDGLSPIAYAQDATIETPPKTEDEVQNTEQWNHEVMNIQQAWDDGYTGEGATIAILDTGFYHRHPDITMAGGYSVFPDDAWSNDHSGHGTHIAGIIGAHQGTTYQGIAPGADLYGIKIYHEEDVDEEGYVSTDVDSVIKGIRHAIDIEADILVISSGLTFHDEELYEIILEAYNNGILVIAASGNGNASVNYPASYPEVVAVTAVDERLHPALDIIYGQENDFTAPGVNIGGLSIPDSPYSYPYIFMSGSSQAAPHAAGLAAILMEKYEVSGQEVREIMQRQARNIGDPGLYGHGLIQYVSRNEENTTAPSSQDPEQAEEPPEEIDDVLEEVPEILENGLPVRKPSSSREADLDEEEEEMETRRYYQVDAMEQEDRAVLGYDVLPIIESGGTLEVELADLTSLFLAEDQVNEVRDRNIQLTLSKGDVSWTIPPANLVAGDATLRFYEGLPVGIESPGGSVTPIYTTSIYQEGARQIVYPSWMEIAFDIDNQAEVDSSALESYAWDKRETEWFETLLDVEEEQLIISTRHSTAMGVFNPDEMVEEDTAVVAADNEEQPEEATASSGFTELGVQLLGGALIFFALLFGVRWYLRRNHREDE